MGPGWWVASDGKWYPPRESDDPPMPGWWLAADGKWYPPREAQDPPAPGWWLASDGRWYPPSDAPGSDSDGPVGEPAGAPAAVEATPPEAEPESEPEPDQPAPVASAPAEPEPVPAATDPTPPATTPAVTTPAVTTPAVTTPTTATPAAARTGAPVRHRASAAPAPALDASEQIRRRDQASREDAVAQFPARFLAAARAVQVLESELGRGPDVRREPAHHERKGRARAEARAAEAKATASKATAGRRAGTKTPTAPDGPDAKAVAATPTSPNSPPLDAPAPSTEPVQVQGPAPEPPPAAPPEPPATVPVGRPTNRPGDRDGWPAPRPGKSEPRTPAVGQPGGPLVELRPSPLGADLEHLGDRLLVFEDRVELRDRADHVRQAVAASDIADVAVQRKFTGAVLTIAGHDRDSIVVKGIKPEQADEVHRLIHTRLRHQRDATADTTGNGNGAAPTPAASTGADTPPEESALAAPSPDAVSAAADRLAILNRSRLNEADLLRKLADLHRAGVLSDPEFADKVALVGRLVSGETVVVV